MEILKVSSKSNSNSVAGALANVFREKGSVEIQAVGAGARSKIVYNALKDDKNVKNIVFNILFFMYLC